MKWEHAVQRFTGRQGLGAWAVFAQGGNAQQCLQHQEDFATFVCSSLGAHLADG